MKNQMFSLDASSLRWLSNNQMEVQVVGQVCTQGEMYKFETHQWRLNFKLKQYEAVAGNKTIERVRTAHLKSSVFLLRRMAK